MPEPTPQSGLNRRYLNMADLRRLKNLLFASRRRVEGLYVGRHRSPQRGHSVEFADYRQYFPGDEVGDIDWKVYGRTDKLMIKQFEHQSDMALHLVVDASASMGYAGVHVRQPKLKALQSAIEHQAAHAREHRSHRERQGHDRHHSKYDHACQMAAAIAFLATKQQDKASLTIAQRGAARFERPAGSFTHLSAMLTAMEQTDPAGEADLPDALRKLASITHRRGVVIVLSDLLDDRDAIMQALAAFTHRGSEVIVFHLLHADELKLPDLHDAVLIDSETTARLNLNIADIRTAYEKRIKTFIDTWRAACHARNIDYNLVSTATPYQSALEDYLFSRANVM